MVFFTLLSFVHNSLHLEKILRLEFAVGVVKKKKKQQKTDKGHAAHNNSKNGNYTNHPD